MKKTLSLLLTAAMLLAIIPCLAFSVSAAETGTQTVTDFDDFSFPDDMRIIQASVTSGTSVYCSNANETIDFSKMILNGFGNQIAAKVSATDGSEEAVATDVCIIGKFPQAERMRAFAMKASWRSRANNLRISLSTNGTAWTEVVTLSGLSNPSPNAAAVILYTLPDSLANTAYQYVKIEKTSGVVGNWVGFDGIAFLKNSPVGSIRIASTHFESSYDAFSACWNKTNTTQITHKDVSILDYTSAQLASPTVIDQIAIDFGVNGARLRTSKLYGSTDGSEWEEIAALTNTSYANLTQYYTVHSNKAYSYVKLEQGTGYKSYDWSVLRISVYGYAEGAARIAATNVPERNVTADTSNPAIDLWSDTNTTPRSGSDSDTIIESTVAKFDFPTKISTIYLVSGTSAGRNRGILYEGSMDGEHWETVCSSGHNNDGQYSNATKKVTVNSSKAYLYVRATNTLANGAGKDYHWNVINLAVYGEQIGVTPRGTQSAVSADGKTYGVRIVSTVDFLSYDAIGYEITAAGEGLATPKYWDRTAAGVYSSIYETVDGSPVERDAAYFGGTYISAISIMGISIENYGSITFSIRPYALSNGVKLYSDSFTAIYLDGEYRYIRDPYDSSVADGTDVRVMSCNIMAEWPSYGGDQSPVSVRKEIFFSAIDEYAPTVIGLQEFSPQWYAALDDYADRSKWEILKIQNPNVSSEYVCSTVMYRKDLYTLKDSGMQYYSKFNNGRCRCITWAALQDKTSGKTFCFVSTHWDGDSSENAPTQLAEEAAFVNAMAASYPVIATGDYNANEYTDLFQNFLSQTNSADAMYAAAERVNVVGSWHGFGQYTPSAGSCDHITTTAGGTVLKFETLMYNEQIFCSDHAWLIADIQFAD